MAIKAGQIIHDANGFVIDRIQSAGVTNLNIPEEKVYELGNYQAVATVRDIPDLSFEVESFDTSAELEAILHGIDPTTVVDGDEFDYTTLYPLDIISPFKAGNGQFNIVKGIIAPYLTLEQSTYRFGLRANASQTHTLRGDALYYIPGSPYYQEYTLVDNTLTYTLNNTAIAYTESGSTLYVLSACVKNEATGAYRRLFFGPGSDGYTNTSTTITTGQDWFDAGYTTLHVVYGSTAAASYAQAVHPTASVKPAGVRPKDICVYVGTNAATSTLERWLGVQSVEITRRVNLENDEEFCNTHYVSQDYDTAEVSGSITVKSVDTDDLWEKIAQVSNVATNVVAGLHSSTPLPIEIEVRHPDTGATLKTFSIPDARFTIPAIQGRVQQKLEVTFNFSSDGGTLSVFSGEQPGGI